MTNGSYAASRSRANAAASSASANASVLMATAISPRAVVGSQEPPFDVVIPHRKVARPLGLTEFHRCKPGQGNAQHQNEKKHTDSPAVKLGCRENTGAAFRVAYFLAETQVNAREESIARRVWGRAEQHVRERPQETI